MGAFEKKLRELVEEHVKDGCNESTPEYVIEDWVDAHMESIAFLLFKHFEGTL